MENASKALLIAAALLIVILLITVGIKVVTSTQGVKEQTADVGTMIADKKAEATDIIKSTVQTDSANLAFNQITAENYGDIIEYIPKNADEVKDWKIFYKDEKNVYIITSNRIENKYLPEGLEMKKIDAYRVNWEYGTEPSKAKADLLNENAWTAILGDEDKGIKARGGPTLEMWVASWNANSTEQIEIGNQETVDLKYKNHQKKNLYFPSHLNGNYWIASLSAINNKIMIVENYRYLVTYVNEPNYTLASVRPIVSIPAKYIEKTNAGWKVNLNK